MRGKSERIDAREVELVLQELAAADKKREVIFILLASNTPMTSSLIARLKIKNFRKKGYVVFKDDTDGGDGGDTVESVGTVEFKIDDKVWEIVDRYLHDDDYIISYENDEEYLFKRMQDIRNEDKACTEHIMDFTVFATVNELVKRMFDGVQSCVHGRFSNKSLHELYMEGYKRHCIKLNEEHPYLGECTGAIKIGDLYI
jgi:hypothetical protein